MKYEGDQEFIDFLQSYQKNQDDREMHHHLMSNSMLTDLLMEYASDFLTRRFELESPLPGESVANYMIRMKGEEATVLFTIGFLMGRSYEKRSLQQLNDLTEGKDEF